MYAVNEKVRFIVGWLFQIVFEQFSQLTMKKRFAKAEQSFVGKVYTLSRHQVVVEETIAEGRYLTY